MVAEVGVCLARSAQSAGRRPRSAGGATSTSGDWRTSYIVEVDTIPLGSDIDAIVGLSSTAPTTYSDLAAILRFRPDGTVDARDGDAYRASKTAPRLGVPFIVIQGAEDIVTPTSVVRRYFDVVQAPGKKWIEIPNAGHFAIVTHAAQVRDALVQDARPLAR